MYLPIDSLEASKGAYVGLSCRLPAKGTTRYGLESAMIYISRLLDLSTDSIVETLDRA